MEQWIWTHSKADIDIWTTDHWASIFFISQREVEFRTPINAEHTEEKINRSKRHAVDTIRRIIPKKENLRPKAAKDIEPILDASTCASGSHIAKGNVGVFAKKVNKIKVVADTDSLSAVPNEVVIFNRVQSIPEVPTLLVINNNKRAKLLLQLRPSQVNDVIIPIIESSYITNQEISSNTHNTMINIPKLQENQKIFPISLEKTVPHQV